MKCRYFKLWRQQFVQISFDLVKGNHDIMADAVYEQLQISVHPALTLRNIHFIHGSLMKTTMASPILFPDTCTRLS